MRSIDVVTSTTYAMAGEASAVAASAAIAAMKLLMAVPAPPRVADLHEGETNVARGNTNVSGDALLRPAFATNGRYGGPLARSTVFIRTRRQTVWRNGK